MGIVISHKLGLQKVNVKKALDNTEKIAKLIKTEQADEIGIAVDIKRIDEFTLLIDIGNCGTLSFDFKSSKDLKGEEDWSYAHAVLTDDGKKQLDAGYNIEMFPQNEKYYCASFCKTQFARHLIEHKFVAELIRSVAGRCFYAEVDDEGDYYHTGDLNDAGEAIESLGKQINALGNFLAVSFGGDTQVIKGGETTVKPLRKKK